MAGWIVALLGLIALLLLSLIILIIVAAAMIEDRLNRIYGALWEGLRAGNDSPYLADVLSEMRKP